MANQPQYLFIDQAAHPYKVIRRTAEGLDTIELHFSNEHLAVMTAQERFHSPTNGETFHIRRPDKQTFPLTAYRISGNRVVGIDGLAGAVAS